MLRYNLFINCLTVMFCLNCKAPSNDPSVKVLNFPYEIESAQIKEMLFEADAMFISDRNKCRQIYIDVLPLIENNSDLLNYVIFQIRITEHLNHWCSDSSKTSSITFVNTPSSFTDILKCIDSVFMEEHINETSLLSKLNQIPHNNYIIGLCYLSLALNSKYFEYNDQIGLQYFISAQDLLKLTITGKCFLILSYKEAIQLAINNREYLLSSSFGESALTLAKSLPSDTLMHGLANIAAGYGRLSENLNLSVANYLSAHEILRNSPYVYLNQEALKYLSHFHYSAGNIQEHKLYLNHYMMSVKQCGDRMNINKNLGQFACMNKDWENAIKHFQLAILHFKKSKKREEDVLSTIYSWLVTSYKGLNKFDNAIMVSLQQADIAIDMPVDFEILNGILNDSMLKKDNNYILGYEISEILWAKYQKTKNIEDLEMSFHFLIKCLSNLSSPINTLEESKKITLFSEFGDYFINHGLKVITELYTLTNDYKYLEAYLQNIESHKGGILSGDVGSLYKKHKIPDKYILKEKFFHYKIEKSILSNNLTNDSLLLWQNQLKQIYNLYKSKYPDYIEERLKRQTPQISDFQNILPRDQAMISYKIETNRLYTFTLTKDDVCLSSQAIDVNELDSLSMLQQKMIAGNYINAASKWYEVLIPPSVRSIQKFIIIPDEILNNISFEALIIPNKNYEYFIQHHYASICPSIHFIPKLKNKPDTFTKEASLAMFSFSDKITIKNQSNKYKELPGAFREVKSVENIKTVKHKFYGSSATVSNFKNMYEDQKTEILHLATHGKAVEEEKNLAYLLFRNPNHFDVLDTLYTYDIEAMQSNVKLVVLSACESHKGKIVKQEGLYSLTRSFLRNDADYVISALWNLDDISTQAIIKTFYTSNDASIHDRLRNAKLKMIHSSDNIHPYYWAGLVILE